ncbi:MAG: adenylyl-sulfate kinase [Candidatus Omnitrophica bacterium]|nr:adenylyl-sulfate kinase [Candidatus Omnitrophota bacterium]
MKCAQAFIIKKRDREKLLQQRAFVIWFTGVSGSGKTTLANKLEKQLFRLKYLTYILDGDRLRKHLHKELSYTPEDRLENIRRNGQIARMFTDAGLITICAFMSGIEKGRKELRSLFLPGEFVEIYLDCPINVCRLRDPKGLYKKASSGKLQYLIGFDIPYESPKRPNIILDTSKIPPEECIRIIVKYLIEKKYLIRS